jgi:hypothetical protein
LLRLLSPPLLQQRDSATKYGSKSPSTLFSIHSPLITEPFQGIQSALPTETLSVPQINTYTQRYEISLKQWKQFSGIILLLLSLLCGDCDLTSCGTKARDGYKWKRK